MILIAVYSALVVAGSYADYLAGLYIERNYGSQVSLIAFLFIFCAVLIGMFPIALRITRPADQK